MPSHEFGLACWTAIALLVTTSDLVAQTAYVSNEKDNTLSVIDIKTLAVVDTVDVGQRPRGLYLSPDYKTLYLCASDDDTIQEIDVETLTVRHELPSGENPETFAISSDGKRIYTSNESDNIVTIIDLEKRTVAGQVDVGVEPEGMAVSPDGEIVINTSETTNMAHWIDADTLQIFDNSLVDQRPRHAEFNREGTRLWVSAEIGGTVSVFDVESRTEVAKIPFAIRGIHRDRVQPVGMRLTQDGRYAFVALGPANHVAVVDRHTFEVVKYILVGRRVWHMALTPDEKLLLTTNGVSGDVTVIDVEDLKAIKSIKVGRYPWGVAIRP